MKINAILEPDSGKANAPLMHKQLSQLVVARLREDILSGAYAPGERLVEGRIGEELDVSRVPVREALRALASEGLVEIRPRHGAVVASLDPAAAREMIQIRATLEGLNARLATEHLSPELKQKIEEVLNEGKAKALAGEMAGLLDLNTRFHDLLYAAGANSMLSDLMRSLRDRTRALFIHASDDEIRETWEEHAAILRAVQARDGALAALLAERHVMRAAQQYLNQASPAP
ncbi:GntR family transcriptional regulator [Burkholderia stabilis]|uniref:GntR family transcriptional regulator n=1 Tax=Burkholderia stabilis TaxID=95485 RepID=UPI001F4B66A7|nr:GntR family transcriptional regulator [Burkholderia stabilis]HDR9586409.1 GntR family transcriptional regulator [Burkholderia stabilis]HDR9646508.1 GntR family transcriptional regulator [Burkholderia stabilis]HDR9657235.1 GntR family transcriptional regulator [Burkholderia stabilis]HDR9678178.1 GntR family transcriptional regulator [Burkholderia stabilis]